MHSHKIGLFVSAIATMFLMSACGLQTAPDPSGHTATPADPPACTSDSDCATGQVCTTDGTCADAPSSTTDGGTASTQTLPAPFKSPAACVLDFSERYVSGATCGETRGTLPLMTWDSGLSLLDSDNSGYMGMSFDSNLPAGTYDLSYVGYQDCGSKTPHDAWAQYGHPDQLAQMSPDALAYLQCNWWDAKSGTMVVVDNPSCHIRIAVDGDCNITPAGNMGNFVTSGN